MHKRTIIGAALAAFLATCVASRLIWAQAQPGAAPPIPRIAIVNFLSVIKNYKKGQIYVAAEDKEEQTNKKRAEAMAKKLSEMEAELKVGIFDAAKRKQWEDALSKDRQKFADFMRQANLRSQQKFQKELVPIYQEIVEAVKTYAKGNGIQVVLSYSEDLTATPLIKARHVAQGLVMALHVDPAVDISAAIADILNRRYKTP